MKGPKARTIYLRSRPIAPFRTLVIGLAAALVFALGLAIDPAALVQVAYICGTGGCGVRGVWLEAGLGAVVGAWMVASLVRRVRSRRPARGRSRAAGKRGSRPPAKAKPAARRKPSARAKA